MSAHWPDDRLTEACEYQSSDRSSGALPKILGIALVIALMLLLALWPPVSLGDVSGSEFRVRVTR